MNKYNYIVKFKFDGDINHVYSMHFTIEAESNKEAIAKGQEKWKAQIEKRERLQDAIVYKTTCRKIEIKPRTRKYNSLQNALNALNQYMEEELQ